ncbi:hypothetical protein DV737_g1189, partial [Chaetothyriales sp. CBS 132003]
MEHLVIGVLGGGQLGRMLVEAASRLNVQVAVLDGEGAPAKQINLVASDKHVTGSFATAVDVEALAAKSDVLTYEIEHVDTEILEKLSAQQQYVKGTKWHRIQPSWQTVRTIQDKFVQKQHLARFSIATARSIAVEGARASEAVSEIAEQLHYPLMLKSRTQAYDGRGNFPIRSAGEIEAGLKALAGRPLYAEEWANFSIELAVMVIKTAQAAADPDQEDAGVWKSSTLAYPAVETVHEDSICKLVYAPARQVARAKLQEAQDLARRAVASFAGTGVFGVEMFLLADGRLVVNEVAPRPHNSGHYTIEACQMSQFEAQVRAVLPDLATTVAEGSTEMVVPAAVMLNILGGAQADSHLLVAKKALSIAGAKVHLYGKGPGRPGRKMGHITVVGSSMSECERKMHPLIQLVDAVRAERNKPAATAESILAVADALAQKNPGPKPAPVVAVVMGSDTDLATLKPGLQFLEEMEIPFQVTITSAHRTPQFMLDFGKAAAGRGIKAIIAAAGGAAHLPGMIASVTTVPVIGCPVKASSLDGLDSLLSIVQMPRGVPVATVSIGNSTNAALLAARIVGTSEARVQAWVERHLQRMEEENLAKAARLEADGWREYQRVESWNK